MSLIVGLTGNIACGKSLAGEILRGEGVPVLDSDEVVHKLYAEDKAVQKSLLETFATLDRKAIGRLVFADSVDASKLRKKLEGILHPAVAHEFTKWVAANQAQPILVNLVPLLFEAKLESRYDYIVCIVSDETHQIARIKKRNPELSEDEILRRIRSQMPQDLKAKLSDSVILNNGSEEDLKKAIIKLLGKLKRIKSI